MGILNKDLAVKKKSPYRTNKELGELYRSDPSTHGQIFTEYKRRLKKLKRDGFI